MAVGVWRSTVREFGERSRRKVEQGCRSTLRALCVCAADVSIARVSNGRSGWTSCLRNRWSVMVSTEIIANVCTRLDGRVMIDSLTLFCEAFVESYSLVDWDKSEIAFAFGGLPEVSHVVMLSTTVIDIWTNVWQRNCAIETCFRGDVASRRRALIVHDWKW